MTSTIHWRADDHYVSWLRRRAFRDLWTSRTTWLALVVAALALAVVAWRQGGSAVTAVAELAVLALALSWIWAWVVAAQQCRVGTSLMVVYEAGQMRVLDHGLETAVRYADLADPDVGTRIVSFRGRGAALHLPRALVPDIALGWIARGRTRLLAPESKPADLQIARVVAPDWARRMGRLGVTGPLGRPRGVAALLGWVAVGLLALGLGLPWPLAVLWLLVPVLVAAVRWRSAARAWPAGARVILRLTPADVEVVFPQGIQRLAYAELGPPRRAADVVAMTDRSGRVLRYLPRELTDARLLAVLEARIRRHAGD